MRIIPPRFHMTRHDHADFRRVWRSVAEAALTLFIIVIFCLSAAQVVSLVHQETKNIESEYLHDETSRSNRMLIRRSAEDFQTTVMAYYLGNTDLPLTEMERQRSYFLNMIERILELETAENDDLRRYHSQLLQAVKNIVAYE
ncbi:MAG: hypothetical protein KKA05_05660, partial [Alphaproteobacteria bacterium]|nr:hypothetical protein [Alphaproteobacteria bacterium]